MNEITEDMARQIVENQQHIIKQNKIENSEENTQPDEKATYNKVNNVYNEVTEDFNTPKSGTLGKAVRFQEKEEFVDTRKNLIHDVNDNFGWINVPVQYLPSKGMFYPTDARIQIRAALVQEIRNFSIIDENDLIDIDDKLNMIIDKCCRIMFDGIRETFKDLLEIDRFYIVYSIRELTFKDGENKLQMPIQCNECGNSETIDINKENFNFFEIPFKLEKFYNPEERAFIMTIKETGEQIKIYMPKLGITNFIKHYIRKKRQSQQNLDMAFLNIAPFLFNDWRKLTDGTYGRLMEESFSWSIKKMSIIINVIDMIKQGINPQIKHICSACSAEVQAPISFPGGIKSLFLYTVDTSRDFLDGLV